MTNLFLGMPTSAEHATGLEKAELDAIAAGNEVIIFFIHWFEVN